MLILDIYLPVETPLGMKLEKVKFTISVIIKSIKAAQKCKIFVFLNGFKPKTQLIKGLNLENPKTGYSKRIISARK